MWAGRCDGHELAQFARPEDVPQRGRDRVEALLEQQRQTIAAGERGIDGVELSHRDRERLVDDREDAATQELDDDGRPLTELRDNRRCRDRVAGEDVGQVRVAGSAGPALELGTTCRIGVADRNDPDVVARVDLVQHVGDVGVSGADERDVDRDGHPPGSSGNSVRETARPSDADR